MNINLRLHDNKQIKQASTIAMWSLLNLTFLPVIAFIVLLMKLKSTQSPSFADYHLKFALKLNVIAGIALILVSLLVIILSGLNSGWTWVFVITYFVLGHTIFIVISVWALIRSWSGNKMGYKQTERMD